MCRKEKGVPSLLDAVNAVWHNQTYFPDLSGGSVPLQARQEVWRTWLCFKVSVAGQSQWRRSASIATGERPMLCNQCKKEVPLENQIWTQDFNAKSIVFCSD